MPGRQCPWRADRDVLAQAFAQAGADYISFHPDASDHVHRSVQAIRAAGAKQPITTNFMGAFAPER